MLKKLALVLTLTAMPALADTVTVQTYAGPAKVSRFPARVAVFDIAALDTLAALDIRPAGTVDNVYVGYLDQSREGAAVLGNLFEPDFEAVAALAPDLIVAGGRSAAVAPDLARIAPTVDMTIWEDTVEQGLARLEAYGAIFGKEAEAKALADAFAAKLDATRAALAGKGRALIVMTNGPKISAFGASGRFGWLHSALNLPEAVEGLDQSSHGEAISFEFIRDANPDILIVLDRQSAIGGPQGQANPTLDNALVRETAAWRTGKVINLDSASFYIAGGGIQSMTRTLDLIAAVVSGS